MNGIEVGKDVICIKSHPSGVVKKGQIFEVLAIKKMCCDIAIDVGIKAKYDLDKCTICSSYSSNIDGIWWLDINRFAPLMDISELESILKQEPKKEKI